MHVVRAYVANRLGLDARDRRDAEFAALLHDIGKIKVPAEIINKPGKLTDEEWKIMKTHTLEGDDDMPAHIKAALFGPSLTLPIQSGRLALGTWQGIYLCEHRNRGGSRSVMATVWGE